MRPHGARDAGPAMPRPRRAAGTAAGGLLLLVVLLLLLLSLCL